MNYPINQNNQNGGNPSQPFYNPNQPAIPVAQTFSPSTVIQAPNYAYNPSGVQTMPQTQYPTCAYNPNAVVSNPVQNQPQYCFSPQAGYIQAGTQPYTAPLPGPMAPQVYAASQPKVPSQMGSAPASIVVSLNPVPQNDVTIMNNSNSVASQQFLRLIKTCMNFSTIYSLLNLFLFLYLIFDSDAFYIFLIPYICDICFSCSLQNVTYGAALFSSIVMVLYSLLVALVTYVIYTSATLQAFMFISIYLILTVCFFFFLRDHPLR